MTWLNQRFVSLYCKNSNGQLPGGPGYKCAHLLWENFFNPPELGGTPTKVWQPWVASRMGDLSLADIVNNGIHHVLISPLVSHFKDESLAFAFDFEMNWLLLQEI
ncbi:hypothetical protein DSO57_1013513 [Entomophthora muscae]|uniref:Uncharacterized protein n=1 Tax=Entomophthora muscae TaxID=34485 RepID=A0ACC2TGU9_9FUNG|nr:hypothetical protein DSO57_1013513 [Entomophthora muscae]